MCSSWKEVELKKEEMDYITKKFNIAGEYSQKNAKYRILTATAGFFIIFSEIITDNVDKLKYFVYNISVNFLSGVYKWKLR